MIAEWGSVSAGDDPTAAWERVLADAVREQEVLRAKGLWYSGPADLLRVIGLNRRETIHSAILAWLLDPGAPHGLGTAFVERILGRCFPTLDVSALHLDAVVTQCEVVAESRRADVIVWGTDFTLVIETKVDAGESPNQCDDLYTLFQDHPDARFVFLTPTGRRPESATGDAAEAFVALGFRDVRAVLADLVDRLSEDSRPKPGFTSVKTYLQTLELEFP